MRKRGGRCAAAALAAAWLAPGALGSDPAPPHVLVFSGTYGYRHSSIGPANVMLQELADRTGAFTVEFSEDPNVFSPELYRRVDGVVWNNTTGETPLTAQQKLQYIEFHLCGGGYAGIHAAADGNYEWPDYGELLGAYFSQHPHLGYCQGDFEAPEPPCEDGFPALYGGNATLIVEDPTHPATSPWHGRESFRWADEYYLFRENPRGTQDLQVLLSLDETTAMPGEQAVYPHHQPLSWVKTFRGAGRVFYTNLGHNSFDSGHPDFRQHFLGGLAWVTGVRPDAECVAEIAGVDAGAGELPRGGPPPLYAPESALPAPAAWPFGEGAPRTHGAGRYAGGAYFWTDFLYDDNGAIGVPPPNMESSGAPSFGTYRFPAASQAGNGADLFRIAVGASATDTWWRVDWNTLVDPNVPIAAFGIDLDASAATGGLVWPANTGLHTPGIEWLLVVSSRGAWLHDAAAPIPLRPASVDALVDEAARSFVVRLPRTALDPSGVSTLYVVAGLANAAGDGFLQLTTSHGAIPGQTNVYNVGYREYADETEPSAWFDTGQASALSAGDIAEFSVTVDWGRLVAGFTEPEPLLTGFINRWYVSSIEPHQGIRTTEPYYGNRVQPYMAFVPSTYEPNRPAPVTFFLHSLSTNHNKHALTPNTLVLMCENRGSICLSPLGRGPSAFYRDEAELDYWEAWHSLADHFTLDPERTIQSGFSMGAFGSYHFAFQYPDLYAAVVIMAGEADGDLRLENLRWMPYYHNHGVLDELVPVTGAIATVDQLDALGYRHRFDLYPAEDHSAYSNKDHFEDAIQFMTEQGGRALDPGRVTYRFDPSEVDETLGIGPTGAWWVDGLVARDPGSEARADAHSLAMPAPEILEVVRTQTARPDAQPSPAVRRELTWALGPPPLPEKRLALALDNVAQVALDLVRAGMVPAGGSAADWDGDGVEDAEDNCPFAPNDQADSGGLHTTTPDGVGDACQCGDVTDNGIVNGQDGYFITRHGLAIAPNPLFREPCKCDVTANDLCNGQDGIAVMRAALGLPGLFDAAACPAFTGRRLIEVETDGPAAVTLIGVVPGTGVTLDTMPSVPAGSDGRVTLAVRAGAHTIAVTP